jgi:hypothetical protein
VAQNQAELLVTPYGLVHRIMEGERTPCLSLPMLSHPLLLAWGATLSSEGATPFPGCSESSLLNLGALSLTSQGTGPRLPLDCIATIFLRMTKSVRAPAWLVILIFSPFKVLFV